MQANDLRLNYINSFSQGDMFLLDLFKRNFSIKQGLKDLGLCTFDEGVLLDSKIDKYWEESC